MNFHVVHSDGEPVGEVTEEDFRKRIFSGELKPDDCYWHEGLENWKPISAYKVAAKTVRLTAPPPSGPPVASVRPAPAQPPPTKKFGGFGEKLASIKRKFSK